MIVLSQFVPRIAFTASMSLLTIGGIVMLSGDVTKAQTASIYSISATQGKVQVRREGRSNWTPARVGLELNRGDQIYPERGVTIRVRCPDHGQPVRVKAGVPSGLGSVCLNWSTRDNRGSQAAETLGGIDPTIPYLVTPRHTLLLTSKPTIQWNAVAGATEYMLEVTGPKGSMWKTTTKQNQIVYAGQPLQAGVPYSIVVQTNTGKSSQSDLGPDQTTPVTKLEFRILRPSEAAAVQAEARKISPQSPQTEADVLDLARLYGNYVLPETTIQSYGLTQEDYQTYSLTGDAISLLEAFIQQGHSSPVLHRTLGDLYWQTGLILPAQTQYLKAIARVSGLEGLEDWTLAHHSLAKVYATLNNSQQTLVHYQQAKIGYLFLGDASAVADLEPRIKRLKKATAAVSGER